MVIDNTYYGNHAVRNTTRGLRLYNEVGYIDIHGDSVSYHYMGRDYLGSIRAIVGPGGTLEQATDYTVTSIPYTATTDQSGNRRLHTGKELRTFNGLYHYDNHARIYDPLTGRFTTLDPLASSTPWNASYVHCSNNPLNKIDPTGLFDTEDEVKDWAKTNNIDYGLFKNYRIMKGKDNTWSVVNPSEGIMYSRDKSLMGLDNVIGLRPDGVTKSAVVFDKPYSKWETFLSDCWNSPIARNFIPDYISIGVGYSGIAGVGASTSFELNWLVRGPEASWAPIISATQTVGGGFSVDAIINIGGANFLGETYNLERNFIQTSIGDGNIGGFISGGVSAVGKIGLTGGISSTGKNSAPLVSKQLNLGLGLPCGLLPGNVSVGVSNTLILKDFAK